MIEKLKKLNINSVYQLAVQNPTELAAEFKDTSLSQLLDLSRKILVENGALTNEFFYS